MEVSTDYLLLLIGKLYTENTLKEEALRNAYQELQLSKVQEETNESS